MLFAVLPCATGGWVGRGVVKLVRYWCASLTPKGDFGFYEQGSAEAVSLEFALF